MQPPTIIWPVSGCSRSSFTRPDATPKCSHLPPSGRHLAAAGAASISWMGLWSEEWPESDLTKGKNGCSFEAGNVRSPCTGTLGFDSRIPESEKRPLCQAWQSVHEAPPTCMGSLFRIQARCRDQTSAGRICPASWAARGRSASCQQAAAAAACHHLALALHRPPGKQSSMTWTSPGSHEPPKFIWLFPCSQASGDMDDMDITMIP